jgi:hypothetical protein
MTDIANYNTKVYGEANYSLNILQIWKISHCALRKPISNYLTMNICGITLTDRISDQRITGEGTRQWSCAFS